MDRKSTQRHCDDGFSILYASRTLLILDHNAG